MTSFVGHDDFKRGYQPIKGGEFFQIKNKEACFMMGEIQIRDLEYNKIRFH